MIEQYVYDKVTADPTLQGLITDGAGGYRLYPDVVPRGTTIENAITFTNIITTDVYPAVESRTIQFNIFSQNNSALEAGNLLESLKTMFDNVSLTVTGWRHLQFQRDSVTPNNDFKQVPPVQGYSIDYNVLLEKLRS